LKLQTVELLVLGTTFLKSQTIWSDRLSGEGLKEFYHTTNKNSAYGVYSADNIQGQPIKKPNI
jgi:hypothetical protein